MKRPLRSVLATALFAVLTIGATRGGDWPLVRGDALATGAARSELSDDPQLLWKYTSPESAFEATPVIAAGIVYIGDADGTFHAIDLATGAVTWTQKFDDAGFVSAAAVSDGGVYVGDFNGVVRRLDAATGATEWEFSAESEVYNGPSFAGDRVLVTTEGGLLVAINRETGAEAWRFKIEAPLRCSPIVVGRRVLLAGCDAKLHAIDVETGESTASLAIDGPTGSTPAVRDERLYFGGESGRFQAIDAPAQGDMKVVWTYKDPRRGQGIRTAAALSRDTVVYGSQGKAIYALATSDGALRWKKADRARIESSPVIAGQRVVVATGAGRLLLLDLATGEEVWRYDAGEGFVASPAIADSRLVIGDEGGTLYCFGTEE